MCSEKGHDVSGGFLKVLGGIAAISALLLIAGSIYEARGQKADRERYPRMGKAVPISGRSLNIYCSGAGHPAVIFEGAGHTAGFAWKDIQGEVAKSTQACWYDRAGYGWSDPGPSTRTFKAIANDLHALLGAAGLSGPYVLVGATAGAFHVRVYNSLYPQEVAGAVLIHAGDPDVFEHEPKYMKGTLDGLPPFLQSIGCHILLPLTRRFGILRLMGNPGGGRPFGLLSMSPVDRQELVFLSNNPSTAQTEGEGCTLEESMAEVRAAGTFADKPLVVLAGSTPFRSPSPAFVKETDALNDYWFHQLQPRLAALSTRGRLVVAERAEGAESVTNAIHDVVAQLQQQ
jgi:pimeloyl-ACP methyl ester carboxylesterase